MNITFKKVMSLVLAAGVMLGSMPLQAFAATCSNGHTLTSSKHTQDWNCLIGGYPYEGYVCTVCGEMIDDNGNNVMHVSPTNSTDPSNPPSSGGLRTTPDISLLAAGHIADLAKPTTNGYECYSAHCKKYGIEVDQNGNLISNRIDMYIKTNGVWTKANQAPGGAYEIREAAGATVPVKFALSQTGAGMHAVLNNFTATEIENSDGFVYEITLPSQDRGNSVTIGSDKLTGTPVKNLSLYVTNNQGSRVVYKPFIFDGTNWTELTKGNDGKYAYTSTNGSFDFKFATAANRPGIKANRFPNPPVTETDNNGDYRYTITGSGTTGIGMLVNNTPFDFAFALPQGGGQGSVGQTPQNTVHVYRPNSNTNWTLLGDASQNFTLNFNVGDSLIIDFSDGPVAFDTNGAINRIGCTNAFSKNASVSAVIRQQGGAVHIQALATGTAQAEIDFNGVKVTFDINVLQGGGNQGGGNQPPQNQPYYFYGLGSVQNTKDGAIYFELKTDDQNANTIDVYSGQKDPNGTNFLPVASATVVQGNSVTATANSNGQLIFSTTGYAGTSVIAVNVQGVMIPVTVDVQRPDTNSDNQLGASGFVYVPYVKNETDGIWYRASATQGNGMWNFELNIPNCDREAVIKFMDNNGDATKNVGAPGEFTISGEELTSVFDGEGTFVFAFTVAGKLTQIKFTVTGDKHKPDMNILSDANYDCIYGGIKEEFYICEYCDAPVNIEGELLLHENGTGNHKPAGEVTKALYSCVEGGVDKDYYTCEICGHYTAEDGSAVEYKEGNESSHTVGSLIGERNYDCTTGGYGEDYYACTNAGCEVYVNREGMQLGFWPADPEGHSLNHHDRHMDCIDGGYDTEHYFCEKCGKVYADSVAENELAIISGSGKHTPDLENPMQGNYTEFNGGIKVTHYGCKTEFCGAACLEDGSAVIYENPVDGVDHKLGELQQPNNDRCIGGYTVPHYICTVCDNGFCYINETDENGAPVEVLIHAPWEHNDTGSHKCGDSPVREADFISCRGGYKEDVYKCVWCELEIFADGSEAIWSAPDAEPVHVPGENVNEPDFVECSGGYKEQWYNCVHCDQAVNADGAPVEREEGDGKHTTEEVPATETNIRHYHCKYCFRLFSDAEGENEIRPADITIGVYVGGLEPDDLSPELQEEYKPDDDNLTEEEKAAVMIEEIGNDMVTFFMENQNLTQEDLENSDYEAQLLDVAVKELSGNGEVENAPVGPEGIDILIPYPDGTNGRTFTFLVYHMNSLTCKIDTPDFKLTEEGLIVHFDSLSPVLLVYKETEQPVVSETVHIHNWILTRKANSTHHWYECSSCGAKDEYAQHIYSADEDVSCNICGYVRAVADIRPQPEKTPEPVSKPETEPTPAPTQEPAPQPTPRPRQPAQGSMPVIPVAFGGIAVIALIAFMAVKRKKYEE